MWRMERHVPWGGGNSLKPSHNQDFSLIESFNNLALWGEKKFVSELKRTYKFQRGVNNILGCHANQTRILSKEYSFVAGDYVRSTARNDVKCHAEDNSPKYRMVGEILSILRSFAVQTRIFAKESNIIAVGYVRSTAQDDENLNRLRNKCAMTWNSDMEENNFTDKVFSRFTSHFSLKSAAFTLAEVLVTLGIIGVVSAMTVPTLMQNYQRQSYVTQLHKVYNELSQALLRYQTDKNAINFKEAGLSGSEAYTEFQKNYFKVVQDCGTTQTPCFASSYKKMSGSSTNFKCKYGCMSLASGAAIGGYGNGTNGVYEIVVDVNGQKGPNIFGRDAFTMYIYTAQNVIDDLALKNPDDMNDSTWDSESSVPLTQDQREKNFQRACQGDAKPGEWHGCFGKILNDNWQMNY